jgi:hypothetical protein
MRSGLGQQAAPVLSPTVEYGLALMGSALISGLFIGAAGRVSGSAKAAAYSVGGIFGAIGLGAAYKLCTTKK